MATHNENPPYMGTRPMTRIHQTDAAFAKFFSHHRPGAGLEFIDALGSLAALEAKRTAFFCSAKCPGDILLRAYDAATRWRDEGRVIVSGFHSPVERDCLRILLRGGRPILLCPARTLDGFRIPEEWQPAFDAVRLLVLSPFPADVRRTSARLAAQRNEFVAALADKAVFAHATPGGHTDRLRAVLIAAGKPVSSLEAKSGLPCAGRDASY